MADPNDAATPERLAEVEIKVAGRSNLFIADGFTGTPLVYFGEQMDDTPIQWREFFNNVPGDSHGGPQGPLIDRQVLGRIATINFTLSRWNQEVRYAIENHNGAYAEAGVVADYEIGTLLISKHSFRLLVVPLKGDPMNAAPDDESELFFTYNFPCCLISSPVDAAQGTKYSALSFTLEAHRCPPSWVKRGILWDRDITGLSAAMASMQALKTAAMRSGQVRGPVQVQPAVSE